MYIATCIYRYRFRRYHFFFFLLQLILKVQMNRSRMQVILLHIFWDDGECVNWIFCFFNVCSNMQIGRGGTIIY